MEYGQTGLGWVVPTKLLGVAGTPSGAMNKEELFGSVIKSLRKNSAGYGFSTDESIQMFEEQFVLPVLNAVYELGWKDKAEQVLEYMKDFSKR